MAATAEQVGVKKTALDSTGMSVLAVLAGAFIALGAVFSLEEQAGCKACVGQS
jgi:formate/nitrite transporter FocA (FNT family)